MLTRGKSKRTKTGSKRIFAHKKKKHTLIRENLLSRVDNKPIKKTLQTRGDNRKHRSTVVNMANVLNQKTGKTKVVKITNVVENPANMQYVKRNIINKSSIIDTEDGKARVTSRPGQSGIVNAVKIE